MNAHNPCMDQLEERTLARLRVLLDRCCGSPADAIAYTARALKKNRLGRLRYSQGWLTYTSRSGKTHRIAQVELNDEMLEKLGLL